MKVKLEGSFEIQTVGQTYTFSNTILGCGLENLATEGFTDVVKFCNLGNDGSPVSVRQQGLGNCLYSVSKSEITRGTDEGYYWVREVFEFQEVTGSIKEVGLSVSEDAGYYNRQLIKDAQGTPITLELNYESVKVVTERKLYTPVLESWSAQGIKLNRSDLWFDYPKSFYSEIKEEIKPGSRVSVYRDAREIEEEYTKDNPFKFKDVFEIITPVIKREYEEIKFRINWKWGRYAS